MAAIKKLFLLDGMALVYRAHFALISRPIFTSKGVNSSALYGFTQTLLDILKSQQPTHIAVVFDTEAPTQRHKDFPAYKAQRQEMPEDLCAAIPHVCRLIESFHIPVITCDGWEADDVIGTLVRCAEKEGFTSYMVTPDKDFGQLVSEKTFLYKPSRMGEGVEILGLPEILRKWDIQKPEQVIDILGLWGDASDNIPGVPGIGEKTASKLITQYGSVENLLANTTALKGKLKESLEANRENALLSKKLATILCDAPCETDLEKLKLREPDRERLKALMVEFEFNSLGRRLFGDDFKAGRGYGDASNPEAPPATTVPAEETPTENPPSVEGPDRADLKTLDAVPHEYHLVNTPAGRAQLFEQLKPAHIFAFSTESSDPDPKQARLIGLSFCWQPHVAYYMHFGRDDEERKRCLETLRPILQNPHVEKVGHDLKYDLSVLQWHGCTVEGRLFDTQLAHSLIEPEQRHSLEYLAEVYLGYTPIPINAATARQGEFALGDSPLDDVCNQACELADVAWQLRAKLAPLLKEKGQEQVFYDIESPLIPALVQMEFEGIRIDASALAEFAAQLTREMSEQEKTIYHLAGTEFNLHSPKQLGEILFDRLKLSDKAKKTRTGQYATDEQTLTVLAGEHEIVRRLLEFRGASKLKSTYVDALPAAIWEKTGRVHTTYQQNATSTGRLNSQNPNLQNIPIRTEQGREIRKAFVPRDEKHLLLAADYSQIELRILAAISQEKGMLEAFAQNFDIHSTTAARVFNVTIESVTSEMRRKAKMVNFGIAYGISAFGLAQRLSIPRKEAAEIIEQYFAQFPGIKKYMTDTIAFAQREGYVETITGRRRYIRDIRSANATTRSAAERNAINAPIQGSAADMIKIAMAKIHRELIARRLTTRMLLQVHDELVFDLHRDEEKQVVPMVEELMRTAIPLPIPIVVEIGIGTTWLEAH